MEEIVNKILLLGMVSRCTGHVFGENALHQHYSPELLSETFRVWIIAIYLILGGFGGGKIFLI